MGDVRLSPSQHLALGVGVSSVGAGVYLYLGLAVTFIVVGVLIGVWSVVFFDPRDFKPAEEE